MKKFFDCNKELVIGLGAFIIAFPIVIFCPSPIGCIPRDIGIAIVGYGGAIIGGFLTLYGVWWTIQDNNNNRKRELELQYCPILAADITECPLSMTYLGSEIIVSFKHAFFDDENLNYANSLIQLRNVGRGEIQKINITINKCNMVNLDSSLSKNSMGLSAYVLLDGAFNFIPINGGVYIHVGLPQLKTEYCKQLAKNTNMRIEFSIDVLVEGAFTTEVQQYLLHFFVDVTIKNTHEQYTFNGLTFIRCKD